MSIRDESEDTLEDRLLRLALELSGCTPVYRHGDADRCGRHSNARLQGAWPCRETRRIKDVIQARLDDLLGPQEEPDEVTPGEIQAGDRVRLTDRRGSVLDFIVEDRDRDRGIVGNIGGTKVSFHSQAGRWQMLEPIPEADKALLDYLDKWLDLSTEGIRIPTAADLLDALKTANVLKSPAERGIG